MQRETDWWPKCAFIRDFFFGEHQRVAQRVAAYLARYYVGDEIVGLQPNTDVSALMADSIRRFIDRADFTLVRDDDLFDNIDFSKSISFSALVTQLHAEGA